MKVGVVHWCVEDGVSAAITAALADWECQTVKLPYDARLPDDLDLLILPGPVGGGSLVPIGRQLAGRRPDCRPITVLWQFEPLPDPTLPSWFLKSGAIGRSRLERLAWTEGQDGTWQLRPWARGVVRRGTRFRYYGDMLWLRDSGVISTLAVSSPCTAQYLHDHGLDASVVSWGIPPDWGQDLGLVRDIPVLWMGQPGASRRVKLLTRIRSELDRCGIEMYEIDGIKRPYVFGDERTILLNRTKVVLNLPRMPWDDNSARYYLAAPNKALIVSEPTLPHTPFVPGQHLVEAPIEQLTDTIIYYLTHEEERARIVERAWRLVIGELTLRNAVRCLLDVALGPATTSRCSTIPSGVVTHGGAVASEAVHT